MIDLRRSSASENCDREDDCRGGSDEKKCQYAICEGPDHFFCSLDNKCLPEVSVWLFGMGFRNAATMRTRKTARTMLISTQVNLLSLIVVMICIALKNECRYTIKTSNFFGPSSAVKRTQSPWISFTVKRPMSCFGRTYSTKRFIEAH